MGTLTGEICKFHNFHFHILLYVGNDTKGEKVKEVDLYSAFIAVPHTQGAQVRITQFYLQLHCTSLYLVSVHQMAPPQTEVADI